MASKTLSEELNELMDAQGITPERLAVVTGIPVRFIVALKDGSYSALPAEPYVRGYLSKIAYILKVEPAKLFTIYKESIRASSINRPDTLPGNRFAVAPLKKSFILGVALLLIASFVLLSRVDDILGIPKIDIETPEISATKLVKLTGFVRRGDRITLNGEIVYTDEIGRFEKMVTLSPGLNTFSFNVSRFLGGQSELMKQIYYEEPAKAVNNNPPIQ